MSNPFRVPLHKKAPFVRLLLPLIAGIILQWELQLPLSISLLGAICFGIAYLLFFLFPLFIRFKLQWLQGLILHLVLICVGLLLTRQNDVRHNSNWYGHYYKDSDYLVVRINEPLISKAKSDKATGYVEAVIHGAVVTPCKGKLLLYFAKDSIGNVLQYGDRILLHKNLQQIKNSGNPGAFNYQQYAAFQSTFHNVFLKSTDWVILDGKDINYFTRFIFTARDKVLFILRKNIPPGKDGLGLAEALLIGYTNDLDKDLVQAYSNTGVVHIIAISGMHLALIYALLVLIFSKIPFIKKSKLLQVVLILCCLWIFSILTGAAASVVRSAVMFTFIAIGKNFSKASSTYNTLAAAAFVMLCYNPYFLWDVGFQLSFLAVIGIVIFQNSICNWLYIKNKYLNMVWQLVAISLAAQILTFPICIYYFHQFPNFFLFTNIIAVPLSTVILYAEIALVSVSWVPYLGLFAGKIVDWMIWGMNKYIIWVSGLPYSLWEKIPSTLLSTCLLYGIVIGAGSWLLNKNKASFRVALYCLLFFTVLIAYQDWQFKNQQKLIVYNIQQHQAIDLVQGNTYHFIGDSILTKNGPEQNFSLKPSRLALQLTTLKETSLNLKNQFYYQIGNKKIIVVDKSLQFEVPLQKIEVDILIISKNPKLSIAMLNKVFDCKHYIIDATNPKWKIDQWQQECAALNLNFYAVATQGAFIYNIGM